MLCASIFAGCNSTAHSVSSSSSSSDTTATTTTLGASTTTPAAGESVTLTANISPTAATGTVTFYDDTTSTTLGTGTLSSGVATLTTSFTNSSTSAVTHVLKATYGGSATYAASTSSTVSISVSAASSLISTTTTLTASSTSTTTGTSVTLTAAVSPTAATGDVSFYDETTSTTLGAGTLSSGQAQLITSFSSSGSHVIEAIYSGDSTYATSTSSAVTIVVTSSSSSSSMTLSVSPTTITYGSGAALIAVVTPVGSTGTVTFTDSSTSSTYTATLSSQSVAVLTTTGLSVGSHKITASYGSLTSGTVTVTVTTATAGSFSSGVSCGYTSDGATGANVLKSGTLAATSGSYSTSASDQNAICVEGTSSYASTYLTLIDPTISSSAVTTVDGDSSWYGLDAAVLLYNGGYLTIDGGTATTSGDGGNMVYSYASSSSTPSTLTISNATISSTTTNTSNNHGIYAAGSSSAVIVASNVTATSAGSSSSIVATDNGGGTIVINGGTYKATGGKSAGIYSTGNITGNNATFTSTGAEAAVIEGSNVIYLNNATLNSASSGTHRGIFLYQSMSGDAENDDCGDKGDCFQMTNGTFNYTDTTGNSSADSDPNNNCTAFEVFNQTAWVTLTDVSINNSCNTLLLSSYNDQWVSSFTYSSSTGLGKANFYAYGTTLTGNIIVGYGCTTTACTTRDTASTANIYLYKDSSGTGSKLTGMINTHDTGGGTTLTMDATSHWVVTGTSYLGSLTDADTTYSNITCQTSGCKVYVGGSAIAIN